MDTNYYTQPAYIGPRRGRKKYIENARREHMERQVKRYDNENKVGMAIDQMAANMGMPAEFAEALKAQLQAANPAEVPELPPDAVLRRAELERLSEMFVGTHIEQTETGWKLHNFNHIVQNATSIEFVYCEVDPYHRLVSRPIGFLIHSPDFDRPMELTGTTADAFHRFLFYSGLMLVENSKVPCPNCGTKEPQDCEECGGLGWVLKGEEPGA